ncbi:MULTISPECIES: hypothetical protein [Chitinophagaceae]
MRRIIYFLFFLSYFNVLTLIPGIRAAMLPSLEHKAYASIGEDKYDDYDSVWELLLTEVLEQKDTEYQSEDFPISAHYFTQSDSSEQIHFHVSIPHPLLTETVAATVSNSPTKTAKQYNSSNALAQYHDYLFRLTPF